jgi:hypothetical protein
VSALPIIFATIGGRYWQQALPPSWNKQVCYAPQFTRLVFGKLLGQVILHAVGSQVVIFGSGQ